MFAEPVPATLGPQTNWVPIDVAVPPLVHELRNAVATLSMALELADVRLRAAGDAGPALHAGAAPVVAHTNHMLADLLALTRPPRVRCAAFDLCAVVGEAARAPERRRTRPSLRGSRAALDVVLPAQARAFGDAAATGVALRHVLRNAREALPGGRGQVVLEVREGEAAFEVHVLDDGAGIAETVRGKLFAPFVSAKRRHLGLGLTHAWRHMRAQRGSVAATPRAAERFGCGASFCLSVPRDGAAAPPPP